MIQISILSFLSKNIVQHDGVLLNNENETYTVLYSKYSFLKAGDVISYSCLRDVIPLYKKLLITTTPRTYI